MRGVAVFIDDDQFAGFHIADHGAADGFDGAAFRCENIRIAFFTEAEGFQTEGVADTHELFGSHNKKGISAGNHFRSLTDGDFQKMGFHFFFGDEVSENFRIGAGVEYRALFFHKFLADLIGIGQIAVMGNGKSPFYKIHR